MSRGEQIATVTMQVRIFKKDHVFGYEIEVAPTRILRGWSTREGLPLHSEMHAWRTALRICKDHSPLIPGLGISRC